MAVLNSDYTVDPAFNYLSEFEASSITGAKMLSDGSVIICIDELNDAPAHIYKLFPDGTRDESFPDVLTGYTGVVEDIEEQTDGKILLSGDFYSASYPSKHAIMRIFPDGSPDDSFQTYFEAGYDSDWSVNMTLLADGKILTQGSFSSYNGDPDIQNLMRLNTNGTWDASFTKIVVKDNHDEITALDVQDDGKILIGGNFHKINGATRNKIARLNADGSLDLSFNPGAGFIDVGVYDFAVLNSILALSDGKIIVAGIYDTYNGTSVQHVIRLNADATLDNTFHSGTGPYFSSDDPGHIKAIVETSDGNLVLAGLFKTFNDLKCNHFVELENDGDVTANFLSLPGFNGEVNMVACDPDGNIFAGGHFTAYANATQECLAKFYDDGSRDTFFNVDFSGVGIYVNDIAFYDDGKILAGGSFSNVNGTSHHNIVRLFSNGTVDASFTGSSPDDFMSWLELLPDGKIMTCKEYNQLRKLEANGPLDATFSTGSGFTSESGTPQVDAFVVAPDGNYLVCGQFDAYQGISSQNIVKMQTNGLPDISFTSYVDDGNVYNIQFLPDGDFIAVGKFSLIGDPATIIVARFNPDGTIDDEFESAPTSIYETSWEILLLNDEIVLIGGAIDSYNGFAYDDFVALNINDGSVYYDFYFPNFHTQSSQFISLALQQDGKILVGGGFTSFDATRDYFARMHSPLGCITPSGLYVDNITTSKAKLHCDLVTTAESYNFWYRPVGALAWTKKSSVTNFKTIKTLLPETEYEFKVRAKCSDGDFTDFSAIALFTTLPLKKGEINEIPKVEIYPNPASDILNIETQNFNSDFSCKIFDIAGNQLKEVYFDGEKTFVSIDISHLPEGMFFLQIADAINVKTIQFYHQ